MQQRQQDAHRLLLIPGKHHGQRQIIHAAAECIGKRNGNLLFTLRPIQEVIDEYYDRQLEELELATERQRVVNLLLEQKSPA